MGAVAPLCKYQTGCLDISNDACCTNERDEDEEFYQAVSYSGDDKSSTSSSFAKIKSHPAISQDGQRGQEPYLYMSTSHWNDCAANDCMAESDFFGHVSARCSDDSPDDTLDYGKDCRNGDQQVFAETTTTTSIAEGEQLMPVHPEFEGVPLVEGIELLSPDLIQELIPSGKIVLVDVRGADRASGLIAGARHVPAISITSPFVVRLPDLVEEWKNERLIVFFCQFSRHRAPHCANLYRGQADSMQRVAVLEGGFRAWQSKRLPVQAGRGSDADRASADRFALHQGQLIRSQIWGVP